MTECTQTNFGFPSCKSRKITADFSGGDITSNGGVLLLRQADSKLGLTRAAARLIPDIGYLLFIVKQAYKEFELRVGEMTAPHGEKTARIEEAVKNFPGKFSTADLHRTCPGVSIDLVRSTLKRLRQEKAVKCLGKGLSARWIQLN